MTNDELEHSRRSAADLNAIVDDPHVEGVDAKSGIVTPLAVTHAEPPGMPGARDVSFVVKVARAKRCPHMRAKIVNGIVLPAVQKNSDEPIADLEGPTFAFGNRADFGNGRVTIIF
jgi:hypothetical protein